MATSTKLTDLYSFNATTGTIDPADYADVEASVKSDICSALEVENDVQMSTPMGRIVEWFSQFFTSVLGLNVQNANQLLVHAAAGQQLDAIAQWFQLSRKPKSYSSVDVTCNAGEGGTTIDTGSTVRNENGDVFEYTGAPVTISEYSSAVLRFEAVGAGPINVAQGTVNIIDSPIAGWESCINASVGELGADIETDESLRERIQAARTTAPGFLGAIKNAIEDVIGNGSCMVIENNTNAPLDVHGINMSPHSILVCVSGLDNPQESYDADSNVVKVAKAIFDNKPCGTGYTKITSPAGHQYVVPITDVFGNEYNVYFSKPIEAPITVDIIVQKRNYTGSDIIADVKSAISDWFENANLKCGESIYASDIIRAVEEQVSGIVVIDCKVSDGGVYKGSSYIEIDAIHKAVLSDAQDAITVRQLTR